MTVVKKKKKPIKIPGVFTNKYKIRFGFTPFADHTNPSEQMCHEVFDILAKYHAHEVKLERYLANPDSSNDIGDAGPMHAGQEVTFTAILRTVLSQATSNLNALYAEKCLIDRFRYNFLGARVKGETANYHEMRKTPEHVLAQVLAPGGLHIKKAKLIKNCLDKIYEQNMARATPEEREKAKVIENGDAVDFVPGMLSLDYMQSMSTQEKFDHLVSFDGIGIKTAACILCFNFEIPVFAVDTHVYRMAQMLRWVPDFITQEDHVFMHLDHKVPDELKYGLHQAFWWHGQHCYRCKGTTDKKSKGWDDATCPLEHLIDRDNKIGTRNKGAPKEGEDAKPKKKKPKIEPGEKKIPSLLGVKKFKSAEEAAAAGYEIDRMPNNDAYGVRRANFLPGERVRWARVKKEQE